MGHDQHPSGPSSGKKPSSAGDDVGLKRITSKFSSLTTQHMSTSKTDSGSKQATSRTKTPFPGAIDSALNDLQKFVGEVIQTECCSCQKPLMHDFKVSRWFQDWIDKNSSGHAFSICSAKCSSKKCGAMTCVGCGKKPRIEKFTSTCHGLHLDWCCESGRLFAFWVALCKYDEMELQLQMESAVKLAAHAAKGPSTSTGIGYGTTARGTWSALIMSPQDYYGVSIGGGWSGGRMARGPRVNHTLNFQQADDKTDPVINTILSLIIELLPVDERSKIQAPIALRAMIQLSLLSDKVADLLRNDSLRNVSQRSEVYYSVLEFVHRLGKRSETMYLVCDQRFLKKRSNGLQVLSAKESFADSSSEDQPLVMSNSKDDKVSSVVDCMAKLALQAKQFSETANAYRRTKEFDTGIGKDMLRMAFKIDMVYNSLTPSSLEQQAGKGPQDNASAWDAYHEKHRIDQDSSISNHLCSKIAQQAQSINFSLPGRMRRLVSEQAEMTTGLPQYIFVKAHDSLPHIMKCLMVGPEGTPYEDGLFEFDILCLGNYPKTPPSVQFLTTGRGTVRFNPNLYDNGKGSLLPFRFLLGTWPGPEESKWQPKISTLQSVLVSIQAMILTKHPMENEPGYENHSRDKKDSNRDYNYQCQANTMRYAVLDWMQRPEMKNGPWKDVVATYFRLRGDKVLATARNWAKSNRRIERFAPDQSPFAVGLSIFGSSTTSNLVKELESALGRRQ